MLSDQAQKIADEAKAKAMWIYSPLYKHWYSPEDFKHIFHYAHAKEDFLNQLQIRNPVDGINAGFTRIAEIQTKLNKFAKSVLDYYSKK
jgi:hypothetical protein